MMMSESKIKAESNRRTLLAEELLWQMYEVVREGDYTWMNALNDTFDLAVGNGDKRIERQCIKLYGELGFMKEVDPSKITVFGGGGKMSPTRGLYRRGGKYFQLER